MLWTKIAAILNRKLELYPAKHQMTDFDVDMINQINCFLKVDMAKYGGKIDLVKIPSKIRVKTLDLSITSVNKATEYAEFYKETSILLAKHT